MKKIVFFSLLSVCFFSCKNENKVKNVERAFYYWKSDNSLNLETENKLNSNNINKVYVKFFEVDYSEAMGNFPYDKMKDYGNLFEANDALLIVPAVFVKNEIFKFNSEKDLDKLADNIVFLINKRFGERFKRNNTFNEIQIDCDWTLSTKEKYFYLLKKIKEISRKQLSCTLRLYPYKYKEKMGIPPVDKAMLMCYNLVKPLTNSSKNSILDITELKSYLNEKRSYPIHLDVALPVFSWAQLYQNNQFQKLVATSKVELKSFAKNVKPMWYEVTKDTSMGWRNYYRIADQIKYEDVSAKTIQEAIAIIQKNVALDATTTIALFDLDDYTFMNYSDEEISSFYNNFTK